MSEMECIQKYRMYQRTRVKEKIWIIEVSSLISVYNSILKRYLRRFDSFIDVEKLLINEFIYYLHESYPYGDYTFANVLQDHCVTGVLNRFIDAFKRECESIIYFTKQNTKGYSWQCEQIHPGYKIQIKGVTLVYD
jgi:hypothetical protein